MKGVVCDCGAKMRKCGDIPLTHLKKLKRYQTYYIHSYVCPRCGNFTIVRGDINEEHRNKHFRNGFKPFEQQ